MSNITKKISSLVLILIGAGLFYGFLVVKTWHAKSVYLDCVISANGDQSSLALCSKK